jgi:hypothetical protein
MYDACVYRQKFTLEDGIGSHARSLEAFTCVQPITFLSGGHFLTGWNCKFRPNTESNSHTECNPNPNPNLKYILVLSEGLTMDSVQTRIRLPTRKVLLLRASPHDWSEASWLTACTRPWYVGLPVSPLLCHAMTGAGPAG